MDGMTEPDFIAIWDSDSDGYKWYDRAVISKKPLQPLTAEEKKTCCEVTYVPSGRLTQREDGAVAEIWIPQR